jgi:chemosensory pili system protein ChpA (sensor histidine kinase/response regulator)
MNALIVDDDLNVARLTRTHLERQGFTVTHAPDGMQAMEYLQDHIPDLVVLDVEMPHMNGLEFLKLLRLNEDTRDTPVIMLTANDQPEDVSQAVSGGANYYLTKPFQPTKLHFAVKMLLSRATGANAEAADDLSDIGG